MLENFPQFASESLDPLKAFCMKPLLKQSIKVHSLQKARPCKTRAVAKEEHP